jgi:hypothetical protein
MITGISHCNIFQYCACSNIYEIHNPSCALSIEIQISSRLLCWFENPYITSVAIIPSGTQKRVQKVTLFYVTWTSLPETGTLILGPFDRSEGQFCLYLFFLCWYSVLTLCWFVRVHLCFFFLFSNNKLVSFNPWVCYLFFFIANIFGACHNCMYPSHVFIYSLRVSLKHKIYYV